MHPGSTCKKGHLRNIAKAGQCWKAGPPRPLPGAFWGSRHYLRPPLVPGFPHFTSANPQQFVRLCLL